MKRKSIWKIFSVPSPSELGMTNNKSDAMPMRDFKHASDTSPTWEDWHEKVQKEYPIRYFFAEQVVPWLTRKYVQCISDTLYWIKCHTLTKYKYHMLDLRQPGKEPDAYRYGWLDCDNKMLYALFNILNLFVEQEMPNWYCPSEEEVAKDHSLAYQRVNYLEVKAIHYWWNVERKRQEKLADTILHDWFEAKGLGSTVQNNLRVRLDKIEMDNVDKTEEMILRLLKIRRSLWT
jgi:hypothetical protein